jgi:hypothetical protein
MSLLAFVTRLLTEGSARLAEPPRLLAAERDAVLAVLHDAHRDAMLDVAGPPLPFVPGIALRAAEWAARACWLLLHQGGTPAEVENNLPVFSPNPASSEHATADVVFRFVVGVHRRARTADPAGALAVRLEEMLRRWPLSGVLAEIEAAPLTPVDFGGHPGLLLLYAERFAARPRAAWLAEGPAREYLDLCLARRDLS